MVVGISTLNMRGIHGQEEDLTGKDHCAAEMNRGSAIQRTLQSQTCNPVQISTQNYYSWKHEFGAMKVEHAERFKEIKRVSIHLKMLVEEMSRRKDLLIELVGLS